MKRFILSALALVALVVPASGSGATSIPEIQKEPLADVDKRSGSVEPTAAQQQRVSELGARVTWNQFGTPKALVKDGGFLAEGLSGASAVDAARTWLSDNRALFRLGSLDGLELYGDSELKGSNGHAVHFRQRFGDLDAGQDGLVTVGVVGTASSGWNVAYVSSSLTGDTALGGATALEPQAAWLNAAADVGRSVSFADIGAAKTQQGWTVFAVNGFTEPQRARLVAVPTPQNGVRPAYETLVIDNASGNPTAFVSFVDAQSGEVLVRNNRVFQSHPVADTFTGEITGPDGSCQTRGPWTVDEDEQVHSIGLAAEAVLTTNDIVLELARNGTTVASQDTLFSPEALAYAPTGGVQPGVYTAVVCDFVDGSAWDAPQTYTGQIVFNGVAGTSTVAPFPPKWDVFPANPPLDYSATDTRKLWCWESNVQGAAVPGCEEEVKNSASRAPWDFSPRTGAPTFSTVGNNAVSAEAWANPPTVQFGNLTPGPTFFRPVALNRVYSFPWTNQWFAARCDPTIFVPGSGADISAAVTNLFAMHNRMHDWSYHLGFTEENWNAQESNFGNAGQEHDPIIGDAQSGGVSGGFPLYGGRDNANMLTLPDGVPSLTNMYLWQPLAGAFYSPCVDGDYDMAVIGHEYTHMIENRMIGKGSGRSGHHAGAMGESTADLNAMEVLNEYGYVPVSGENRYAVGAYVTGAKDRGIRNYGMNDSPLNFSDMGYDITGPQVHADGEIWSATNFQIRQALIDKYDGSFSSTDQALQRSCAEGERPASVCPGNRRWIQLVYDAYLLMPVAPSMLEARDASLAADRMRFGGANQAELWGAFAARGFGEGASSSNSNANTDTDPTPSFASPLHDEATVTFSARDENGDAVSARIYVGDYEGRVSPIADTNPSTSGQNLDETAAFVAGEYDFLANAPGYGHVRFSRTLAAGENVSLTIEMSTNWASKSKGAVATGDGSGHANLIDDTEVTNWVASGAPVEGRSVVVDLGGGVHEVGRIQVSALLSPGQNRFTALRQFQIWTCNAAVQNCGAASDYTLRLTSAEDAFPGEAPRPVAPQLILREFDLPATVEATHVRFVVLDNQCTGQAQFHGTQDNDPLAPSDCRTGKEPESTGSLLLPRDTTVVAAELQVFSPAVEAQPDLTVEDITLTDPPGRSATFTATVANDGTAAAGASQTRFADGTTQLCVVDTPAIEAGASVNVTCTANLKRGEHTITATADSGQAVEESDEANNARTETFTVN